MSEFNRLVSLAAELGVRVEAELQRFAMADGHPDRPWLAVPG